VQGNVEVWAGFYSSYLKHSKHQSVSPHFDPKDEQVIWAPKPANLSLFKHGEYDWLEVMEVIVHDKADENENGEIRNRASTSCDGWPPRLPNSAVPSLL
jgi:hypothetical protein